MRKQTKLTKSARGRECQVRLPGICNRDPEKVVLAHLNGGGMGTKHPDLFGAFACSSCHDEIDRKTRLLDPAYARLCHLEGMVRTQLIWLSEGLIDA